MITYQIAYKHMRAGWGNLIIDIWLEAVYIYKYVKAFLYST